MILIILTPQRKVKEDGIQSRIQNLETPLRSAPFQMKISMELIDISYY